MQESTHNSLMTLKDVKQRLRYSSTQTIYNLMEREGFPRPIRFVGRSVRWISSEVDAWVNGRIETSPRAGGAA